MTLEFRRFRLRFCFSFFALLSLMLLCGGGTVALLCFGASLLHECGHLLFLSVFHADVRLVSLGAGRILIDRRDGGNCGFFAELMIALGGILVNLLLCVVFGISYALRPSRTSGVMCVVNGVLAFLNLLPVRSLDCIRVMELLLQRCSAEQPDLILNRVSSATVCLFSAFCICLFCCGLGNPSLAAVCVYLIFLHWKTE